MTDAPIRPRIGRHRPSVAALVLCLWLGWQSLGSPAPAAAAPEGQMTWAVHISLAPLWFDPADTPTLITPFMIFYALHDALVKPMPGQPMAPSLAESWSASADGLSYDFVLRKGAKFHNGDPVTAEDVKFSFERYRGGASATLKKRVAAVEVLDAQRVRFRLQEPWADFMTFYGTAATGAGVDRAEEVRREGRRRRLQEGAHRGGPVQVRLVHARRRARDGSVRRLLAQDARGQAARAQGRPRRGDALRDAQARRGRRGLRAARQPRRGAAADARVSAQGAGGLHHLLARLPRPVGPQVALARPARAPGREPRARPARHEPGRVPRLLGSSPAASFPPASSSTGRAPSYPHDPDKAKQLLAEAGYPRGFDAGTTSATPPRRWPSPS